MEITNVRTDSVGELSAVCGNNLSNAFIDSFHNNGTDNNICDSFRTARNSDTNVETNNKDDVNIPVEIYRYKFTNEFTNELFKFRVGEHIFEGKVLRIKKVTK